MAQDTIKSYCEQGVPLTLDKKDPRRSLVQTMAVKDVNVTLRRAEKELANVVRTESEVDATREAIYARIECEEMSKPEEDRGDLRQEQENGVHKKSSVARDPR